MDPNEIVGVIKPNGEKLNLSQVNDKARAAARTCVLAGLMRGIDGQGSIIYIGSNNEPQAPAEDPAAYAQAAEPTAEKSEKPKGDNGIAAPEQEK